MQSGPALAEGWPFGAFIRDARTTPNAALHPQRRREKPKTAKPPRSPGDTALGTDPETGLPVCLKSGRFGPYIQLGEGEKPKRASIPSKTDPAAIKRTLPEALALPRQVSASTPKTKPIMAGFGRYGPYVEHDGKYVKIDADEVFTIGQNRAVTVIAEGNSGGQGRAARTSTPIKVLGEHPSLAARSRFFLGPFWSHIKFVKATKRPFRRISRPRL